MSKNQQHTTFVGNWRLTLIFCRLLTDDVIIFLSITEDEVIFKDLLINP